MESSSNKALVGRFVEQGLNGRDPLAVAMALAPTYRAHDPDSTTPQRLADVQALIGPLLGRAVPDGRFTTHDLVSEAGRVVWRWTFQGTHTGSVDRVPATGLRITVRGMTLFRCDEGRIVEAWEFRDGPGLARRLARAGRIPMEIREPKKPLHDGAWGRAFQRV